MKEYHEVLKNILQFGKDKGDRTGTGTRSVFGQQMRFDLSEGFPLVTTKKVFIKGIIHELLWLLSGDTNIKYLTDNGVHIWDEWADETGGLGPVYGKQWRDFGGGSDSVYDGEGGRLEWTITGKDQIADVIERIKSNPSCRRLIVSAWNPNEIEKAALPPCHCFFQFNVTDGKLSCLMYQRSCDMFLGVPFNIASYALLTMMIAQICNLEPGEFIHVLGDAHIYNNHREQVNELLARIPFSLPKMDINPLVKNIDDFVYEDFKLIGYKSHPPIKGKVSI